MLPKYILAISTTFEVPKMRIIRNFTIAFLLSFLGATGHCQSADSFYLDTLDSSMTHPGNATGVAINDTASTTNTAAGILPQIKSYQKVVDSLLLTNKYANAKEPAIFFIADKKEMTGKEFMFYALCVVVFILGMFKTFYSSYFNNLFRVFFNTSIRQTQLTDQLLQAKLPSFILNIFFALSLGVYVWLLFKNYHPPRLISNNLLLPFCIAGIGALYFVKYCILKFMGWMSGMQEAADNYIFVIFLVNKITGIVLIPFIVLLAFSAPSWTNYIVLSSLLVMGLFFLSRYVKTFGVLEHRFPLQPLHFVIYISAIEVIPILLIYKMVVDYVI